MRRTKEVRMPGRFKSTFIGDRTFYTAVLTLGVPIILQNTISNLVGLLNNIMVGQIGTVEMSGVAIANQLIFVFNLTIFGGLAGPGIFGAQFYGAGNVEGIRNSFRYKLWVSAAVLAAALAIFITSGGTLISFYLTGEGNAAEAAAMLVHGREYLSIMLWGLLPFALSQAFSGTLRETGESILPMKASISAVFINLVLNYLFIFGKFGFPELGVAGAAISTVVSRYIELAIIMVYTYRSFERFPFIKGLFKTLKIPLNIVKTISLKGMPLIANELLWSLSITTLIQIFSTRGLNVVAALNISSTLSNIFNAVILSMGVAVSVLVGQALGAGEIAKAKAMVWRLMFLSVCTCIVLAGILVAISTFIPSTYNTGNDVRRLATHFIIVGAIFMIFNSVTHCSYFAIRAGGKTVITFFFDSAYSWIVYIPFTYLLVNFTKLDIYVIYPLSMLADVVKCVIGILIVRTGYWAQNVVRGTDRVKTFKRK